MSGTLVQNRYRLDAELGRGGMGTVYRATNTQTGELVAVKVLNPEIVTRDPDLVERFVREGQALHQLNHPNIVGMVAAVEEGGRHYLVMEYVGGGSLTDMLAAQGRLTSTRVMQIALEVADALTRAHHLGIIHRDLKPANVLLAHDGTPRLADFGIAHVESDQRLTQTGVLMGTIDYLSPQVCQGEPPDERTDIWAFGVMLFEMLSGHLPFEGDSLTARLTAILTQPVPDLAQLAPDAPGALIDLVYRMLDKDPQQRIPSVRLVGAELEAMLKGREPVTPSRVTPALSASAPKHNLPTQLSKFIGREKEIAQVKQKLTECRLVTLTGSGGVGKTRLAIQVAADLVTRDDPAARLYKNGVWLVELASLTNPDLVPGAVATVLGVHDTPDRPLLTALTDYLREKTLLLVLDNCEHVIEACAQLAEHLLQQCPGLRILSSSREALGVDGETALRVPSLSLPAAEHARRETMEQSEAVRLFVERAAAALPGFELTDVNAPAIAQVCRRLDGIALAIELAAARVKLLKVEQIAARLDDAFRLLTGGSRTALPRQQTLRATIDWSYDLLSDAERRVFRRLSVFAGGWTLEAAEAVCAGDGVEVYDVLDWLTQLANKSLVMVQREQGEQARYYQLETTRQYAREKLNDSGEGEAVRDRHLDYYLELAEQVNPKLRSAESLLWQKQLKREWDNLRAALEWSLAGARPRKAEKGLRLANMHYWILPENAHFWTEAKSWVQRGLALVTGTSEQAGVLRAEALSYAGYLTGRLGDYNLGSAMLEESVALYRANPLTDQRDLAEALFNLAIIFFGKGDPVKARALTTEGSAICRALGASAQWELARALLQEGQAANWNNDYETARARAQESQALFEQMGDHINAASSLHVLVDVARSPGDYAAARSYLEEALRFYQQAGQVFPDAVQDGIAATNGELADVDRLMGNYEAACARLEECLSYFRHTGDKVSIARSLRQLGRVMLAQGDYERATGFLRTSLLLEREMKSASGISISLAVLAEVLRGQGQFVRAARLLGAIESDPKNSWQPYVRADYAKSVEANRAALGEETFAAACAEGRAMTLELAVAYALEETTT